MASTVYNVLFTLHVALGNEQRAHDFYSAISTESPDPEVRAVAAEFADEEQEHLGLLRQWLSRVPQEGDETVFDPDPPNMPE